MKYIKKDEFKGIRHNLKDKSGKLFIIENDVMENDEIYELKKFMFDILQEELKDLDEVIEKIEIISEEKQEIANEIIETFIEEIKQEENIVETKKERKKNKK